MPPKKQSLGQVVSDYGLRKVERLAQSRQQASPQPVDEIRCLEIAFFDTCTGKPAVDSGSSTDAPCPTSLSVGWIADILTYRTIGMIPPSCLLIKYKFVEKNKIFRDES